MNDKPAPHVLEADRVGSTGDTEIRSPLTINLPYRRLGAALWIIAFIIIGTGVLREGYVDAFGVETALGRLWAFTIYDEFSLASWWGTLQLAIAAALLAANGIAETRRRWKPYWFILAAIFIYLSIDETVMVHESLINVLAQFHFTGLLFFSWIIPYGIACVILGVIFLPFLRALPIELRLSFILAGALYVGSALGLEAVEGYCATEYGTGWCWQIANVTEEIGEMTALTFFILALLRRLRDSHGAVTFEL
jgi:hypothetical protein